MIYLIETTYYNKTTQEIIDLLKIGYTGDSNRQNRYAQYRLHNPLSRVLYEIPEATELEEKKLQYYFREYQYGDYGNEWFEYSDKILDYFKNHTTKESLIDLPDVPGNKRAELSKFRGEVRKAVEYVLNVKVDQGDIQLSDALKQVDSLTNRIMDRRIRTTKSLWKYIEDVFDVLPSKYTELDDDIRDEVSKFMGKFKDLTRFPDKMRLLCESSMTDEAREVILNQVPLTYKNYYLKLGPSRLYALGYNITYIKREYSDSTSDNIKDLDNKIHKTFIIGKKYLKSQVKEMLRSIYKDLDYNRSPKASDIESYFEVKEGLMTNKDTGKRDRCYEILKRKETL